MSEPPAVLADQHWQLEDFRQRMTAKEWRQILLRRDDSVTFRGRVRKLATNDLGAGVMEVFKAPLRDEPSALSRRTELLRESANLMHEAAMFLSSAVGIDMSRQLLNKVAAIRKELGDG